MVYVKCSYSRRPPTHKGVHSLYCWHDPLQTQKLDHRQCGVVQRNATPRGAKFSLLEGKAFPSYSYSAAPRVVHSYIYNTTKLILTIVLPLVAPITAPTTSLCGPPQPPLRGHMYTPPRKASTSCSQVSED